MNYPSLSREQLVSLEKELVSFLIVHGIDGETWKCMNAAEPEKAEKLVGLFSKTVWDKIADETETMSRITEKEAVYIKMGPTEGFLLSIQTINGQLSVHTGTKKISQNRRQEMMDLFSQGFQRTSQEEYSKALENYVNHKSFEP